ADLHVKQTVALYGRHEHRILLLAQGGDQDVRVFFLGDRSHLHGVSPAWRSLDVSRRSRGSHRHSGRRRGGRRNVAGRTGRGRTNGGGRRLRVLVDRGWLACRAAASGSRAYDFRSVAGRGAVSEQIAQGEENGTHEHQAKENSQQFTGTQRDFRVFRIGVADVVPAPAKSQFNHVPPPSWLDQ